MTLHIRSIEEALAVMDDENPSSVTHLAIRTGVKAGELPDPSSMESGFKPVDTIIGGNLFSGGGSTFF